MGNRLIFCLFFCLTLSCDNQSEVFIADAVFVDSMNKQIGRVEIIEQGRGSNFRIELSSLNHGYYAMHIHEKGVCEPPNFTTSGNHHGLRSDGTFAGDFKPINIKKEVNKYTNKIKDFNKIIFLPDIFLNPSSESSIMDEDGSSIIVHANMHGGARIACAVIKIRN